MKRAVLFSLLAAAGIAAQAQAPAPGFVDRARVERVEPQYETVQVPRQECTSQWVTEQRPVAGTGGNGVNYGGVIVGGVAGGLLGNQVGKGHGKEAATAAGAVIGALAGNHIANGAAAPQQYEQAQREVRQCRTVNDVQQRLTGYRVTLDYKGYEQVVMTREHPGNSMPVRVSVMPMDEREYHRR